MELLTRLGQIQQTYGFLPAEQLMRVSEEYELPVAEVYSRADFYEFFTFEKGSRDGENPDHTENLFPLREEGVLLTYSDGKRWEALEMAEKEPDKIIPAISESGLLGRSGSGFPVGVKWKLTADTDAPVKYVVCNADEGEPGTGKDRVILSRNPWSVIEGMAICALAAGAQKGCIYLREEYADLRDGLEEAIASAPLREFDLQVVMGHGAYICGEETALINSIEGKRGETRLKPPFPGAAGVFGQPTVVNNVESFLCIPMIIREGPEAFRAAGCQDYAGSKLFTIFGAVRNPGVYEMRPGMTLGQCIEKAGGTRGQIKAVLTGGGSGTLLTPDYLDMPMTLRSCADRGASFGVASIRVFSQEDDLVREVRRLMEFFVKESCGICPPCRIGLQKTRDLLKKIETGEAYPEDIEQLVMLCEHIPNTARCGLGLAAVTPVRTLLKNFPEVCR